MKHKASEEKLKLIYDTAISLFKDKGYEETSIQDICDACGLTVGSIYHFYNRKLDFLIEFAQSLGHKGKQLLEESKLEDDPFEILGQYYLYKSEYLEQTGFYLCRSINDRFTEIWMDKNNNFSEYSGLGSLFPFISKRMGVGQIKSDLPPERVAWLIQAFYQGIINQWLLTSAKESLIEITRDNFNPIIRQVLSR